MPSISLRKILTLTAVFIMLAAAAETPVDYRAEALFNTSSGQLAPYYIASNCHGKITQKSSAVLDLSASKSFDMSRRFSYGYGVELISGYASSADYQRYDASDKSWSVNPQHPARVWLQQLYGEIKYRGVFLTVGLKEYESALLNFGLSSGDLVESGNSRPITQVRAGFVDFQDIPFTNGWVQIQGEIAYGKFADNDWMENHFNYFTDHINLGGLYTYKRCYFRTKPSQPFSVTVGMQTAGLFGGTTYNYFNGNHTSTVKCPQSAKTFFNMFLPKKGEGSDFFEGNALGSWDVHFRYRFKDGTQLKAYVQKPWEDGSGIGWMNGFDGLWGVEYRAPSTNRIVNGAVVEYLDFTNQSGPIHWSPADTPGTTINTSHATGGDQYYNNFQSNAYANYGMSIGTPFLRSPLYNLDGYPMYIDTRVRGFHVGVTGRIVSLVDYRLLGSYRKGWGDSRIPTYSSRTDTSLMLEVGHSLRRVKGLVLKAQFAIDRGTMYGNNFGACLSISYRGNICFRK